MSSESLIQRWLPRAGLILGPTAWALNQQVTSSTVYIDCHRPTGLLTLTTGAVCAVVALIGIVLSWSAWRGAHRRQETSDTQTRSFVAIMSVMAAALFMLVILVGTTAGYFLPGCYR